MSHWKQTPHGPAFVPPQPQDPMRPIQHLLVEVIDGVIRRAEKQAEKTEPQTAA